MARTNAEVHRWLNLDRDADVDPELEIFDW
jgi:hypothetical protein